MSERTDTAADQHLAERLVRIDVAAAAEVAAVPTEMDGEARRRRLDSIERSRERQITKARNEVAQAKVLASMGRW